MSFNDPNVPIRIGYALSLTGPLAENGRSARLAHQIWARGINAKGGLLGRPVELICHDDGGSPSQVAAIYANFLNENQVDLVIGGYGTNTIAASLPVVAKHNRFLIGLMGLGVNQSRQYPHYFAMIPTGPNPNSSLTEGFFALAASQNPAPKTVALLTADAEFSRNPVLGARQNTKTFGLKIVHEETYPLTTTDFAPIFERLQAVNADILFLSSYLNDSIGLVKAIRASRYRPKMVGGAMIGPQSASVKTALGPSLNGFINYEYWLPVPKLMFDGTAAFMATYQEEASQVGVDPLGYYMAPLAFAQLQVLEQAVTQTGGLDDEILSQYCRTATFDTVCGLIKFGASGEWEKPRVVQTQFQQIKNSDLDSFRDSQSQVVLTPADFASGTIVYPYDPT